MDPGPVLLAEMRDGRPQALHCGHAALITDDRTRAWGDPGFPTYWRSAPKPLQAIPFALVLDHFGLDERALALACASHSGEAEHAAWATRMLATAGLDASALRCGVHAPMTLHSDRPAAGQTPLHNNCSGKHAGMLLACVANGWPTEGYQAIGHPLQQQVVRLLREATGRREIPYGTDGCGLPTFWLPIGDLARVYRWLFQHDVGRRCLDAMAAHPWIVGGTDRFCTVLSEATGGECVAKVGAAGIQAVLHRPSGGALAVKSTAGDARVAETIAAMLCVEQGWAPADEPRLQPFLHRAIVNNAGQLLGHWERS